MKNKKKIKYRIKKKKEKLCKNITKYQILFFTP